MAYSLDDLHAAADRKYGPFVVDLPDGPVSLRSAIKLPKEQRKRLVELQNVAAGDTTDLEDEVARLQEMIRLIVEAPEQADRLLAALGDDDLSLYAELLGEYSRRTQLGEASGSPS